MRVRLAFWYLVLAMLSESAYSNSKEVFEQVRFTLNMNESTTVPKLILFQWSPRVYQEIRLSVRGGCPKASRDYKWFSSDTSIVSVSPYGVIRAKSPGIVTVKAVCTCDLQNFDLIVVKVFARRGMSYAMDDMEVKPRYTSEPNTLFLPIILGSIPLGFLVGHLAEVFYPPKPHIDQPCSSTSRSDRDCRKTKRLRRTLTTMLVKKQMSLKIYRCRWFFGHRSHV